MDKDWFFEEFEKNGLSLRKVADAIGMHPSALSRMLNGERRMQIAEAERLARVLDVSLDVVLLRAGFQPGMSEDAAPFIRDDEMPTPEPKSEKKRHPGWGALKGTSIVTPGIDLTAPADPEWARIYDDDYEVKLYNE